MGNSIQCNACEIPLCASQIDDHIARVHTGSAAVIGTAALLLSLYVVADLLLNCLVTGDAWEERYRVKITESLHDYQLVTSVSTDGLRRHDAAAVLLFIFGCRRYMYYIGTDFTCV